MKIHHCPHISGCNCQSWKYLTHKDRLGNNNWEACSTFLLKFLVTTSVYLLKQSYLLGGEGVSNSGGWKKEVATARVRTCRLFPVCPREGLIPAARLGRSLVTSVNAHVHVHTHSSTACLYLPWYSLGHFKNQPTYSSYSSGCNSYYMHAMDTAFP